MRHRRGAENIHKTDVSKMSVEWYMTKILFRKPERVD